MPRQGAPGPLLSLPKRRRHRLYALLGAAFFTSFVLLEIASYSWTGDVQQRPRPLPAVQPVATSSPSLSSIRGLSPVGKRFFERVGLVCADTGRPLTAARINDNYCDCADGTDEPGTSACANGQFWCASERRSLSASFVDDGICDCCDGADESKLRCRDRCREAPERPAIVDVDDAAIAHPPENHQNLTSSVFIFGLWLFILAHLVAILGGIWYLATRRDHTL